MIADETQDISTIEQLTICIRYINGKEVREEFIGFVDLFKENFEMPMDFEEDEHEVVEPKMTGLKIGQTIVRKLKDIGLDIDQCVGQAYDGAASMSSSKIGAASVILKANPCALYTHCVAHSLNLAVVGSSAVQPIRNMMGTIREVVNFLNVSAKRQTTFQGAIKHCLPEETGVKLKSLCETRWIERHEAIETFIRLLTPIKLTLDKVNINMNKKFWRYILITVHQKHIDYHTKLLEYNLWVFLKIH